MKADAIVWGKNGKIKYVIDLKTTQDSKPEEFEKKGFFTYDYDRQASFYLDILKSLDLADENTKFVFVAVEKKAPFMYSIIEVSNEVIDQGRKKYNELIDKYEATILREYIPKGYGYSTWNAYTSTSKKEQIKPQQLEPVNLMSTNNDIQSLAEKMLGLNTKTPTSKKEVGASNGINKENLSIQERQHTSRNVKNLSLFRKLGAFKKEIMYVQGIDQIKLESHLIDAELYLDHSFDAGRLTSTVLCTQTGEFKQAVTTDVSDTIKTKQKVIINHIFDLLNVEVVVPVAKKKEVKEKEVVQTTNTTSSSTNLTFKKSNATQKETSDITLTDSQSKTKTTTSKDTSNPSVDKKTHAELITECDLLLNVNLQKIGEEKVLTAKRYARESEEKATELLRNFETWKVKWIEEYKEANTPHPQNVLSFEDKENIKIVVVEPSKTFFKPNFQAENWRSELDQFEQQFDDIVRHNKEKDQIEIVDYDSAYYGQIVEMQRKRGHIRLDYNKSFEEVKTKIGGVSACKNDISKLSNRYITTQINSIKNQLQNN